MTHESRFPRIACLATVAGIAFALSCTQRPQEFHVIPMPNDAVILKGAFRLEKAVVVVDSGLAPDARQAIGRFLHAVERASGLALREAGCPPAKGRFVRFALSPTLGPEAYILKVRKDSVRVEAGTLAGFLYACETLKQMLPASVYGDTLDAKAFWALPCATIHDAPRFAYRGMHMDPSRHFWPVEEIKRYLDVMAAYKLNRLHLHLTDDQGWRMEIKRYPRLTEVGAWRDGTVVGKDWGSNDGVRHGGFYTQRQLRDVVDYAAQRGIEVIPEIDLPGHMVAALAAYPGLGCTGGPYAVWQRWGVAKDILCAGNESIYPFLEHVLTEVMEVFPSEYIHIGGDECFTGDAEPQRPDPWDVCPRCAAKMRKLGIPKGPKAKHALQNYVTTRIQRFLAGHGRKIIGWDEILDGTPDPGAAVMSWRGVEGGIQAASRGFDAIMTPNSHLYFDYYQGEERDKEPFGIGGYVPLEKVYAYEPFEGIREPGTESHILGVQANLWTEYIATPEHLEYMLLPRMCALSEVQWCEAGNKDYARFDASLDHTFAILDAMGMNHCLDCRGLVGLSRVPARTPEQLEAWRKDNTWDW